MAVLFCLGLMIHAVVFANGESMWAEDVVYHTTGYIKLPYADVVEPFEAWYDGKNRRSRQSYYDGLLHWIASVFLK